MVGDMEGFGDVVKLCYTASASTKSGMFCVTDELDELCSTQPEVARVILTRHALRIAAGFGCKWGAFPKSPAAARVLLSLLSCLLSAACCVNKLEEDAQYITLNAAFAVGNPLFKDNSNRVMSATFEKAAQVCRLCNRSPEPELSSALVTGARYDNWISDDLAIVQAQGLSALIQLPLLGNRGGNPKSRRGCVEFLNRISVEFMETDFWSNW